MELFNLLVTGGAGFIGSHFVKYARNSGQFDTIVVFDKLTYAADLERLEGVTYTLEVGDVKDIGNLTEVLTKYQIDYVIHFAAESHVDRSLADLSPFIETNIIGTASVIQAIRHYQNKHGLKKYLHISTDEVYGSRSYETVAATELDQLSPTNPYAATKAAADQLVIELINEAICSTLIVRSSNVYGMAQNKEKLIPKSLEAILQNHPVTLYGNGLNQRSWLYVEDYCEILLMLLLDGVTGEIFNLSGKETLTNQALIGEMQKCYHEIFKQNSLPIVYVKDREKHDVGYHISDEKLMGYLADRGAMVSYKRIVDFFKAYMNEAKNGLDRSETNRIKNEK